MAETSARKTRVAKEAPAGKTEQLTKTFEAELRRKPDTSLLDKLVQGRKVKVTPSSLKGQSVAHQKHTLKLLSIIDKFAVAHTEEHGRVEAGALPSKMRAVLEKYSLRKGMLIDVNEHGPLVKRAFDAHRDRVDKIYTRVEELKQKHGI